MNLPIVSVYIATFVRSLLSALYCHALVMVTENLVQVLGGNCPPPPSWPCRRCGTSVLRCYTLGPAILFLAPGKSVSFADRLSFL